MTKLKNCIHGNSKKKMNFDKAKIMAQIKELYTDTTQKLKSS